MEKETYYRSYAVIDLNAIGKNYDNLKANLTQKTMGMAVVKANAYGHGALEVSRFLEERVDYFAVATFEEALELREGGIQKPILILSYTDPSRYLSVLRNQITPTFYSVKEAKAFSVVAERGGYKGKFHVAVDTGMGRIGFPADETGVASILKIARLPYVRLEGVFTHFARADEIDKSSANLQKEKFDFILSRLVEEGVEVPVKHISNSAASIEMDCNYDMCRFGISLYGISPSDEVDENRVKLYPAMEVKSHVIHVKKVSEGTGISYGHIYKAPGERTIATVSMGYADGFNRSLSNVGHVLIHGKKAPITGRVCMDMMMVDVTDIPEVKVGDTVTILGKDGEEEITAVDLERMTDSFRYELLCTFMPRVKRFFVK